MMAPAAFAAPTATSRCVEYMDAAWVAILTLTTDRLALPRVNKPLTRSTAKIDTGIPEGYGEETLLMPRAARQ